MGEARETDNVERAVRNIAVWFDDRIKFLDMVKHEFESYQVETVLIPLGALRDAVEHFGERSPVALFLKVNEAAELEGIMNSLEVVRVQAVISDLEMGDNPLAGLSLLATVGRVDPRCYRVLVTGHISEATANLARGLGVDLTASKDEVRRVIERVTERLGVRRETVSQDLEATLQRLRRRCERLEQGIAESEGKNMGLRRERNRLRRMLRELHAQRTPKKKGREKGADAERDRMLERAESAEQRVQMVLGHQHDLQSIAAAVTTTLGNLCAQPELLAPAIKDKLEAAWTAARHTSVLIRSTLDIATEEKPSKQATGSIRESFEEGRRIIADQMPDRISVDILLPEQMRVAKIPNTMLVRCALNLFTNAKDAIVGAGRIVVTTKARGAARAKYIEVLVRDNGRGIKKRDLPKVFDWGFTTKGSRYGMGLFIVRRIMERYEGQVTIESVRGKGTSVTLRIPVG